MVGMRIDQIEGLRARLLDAERELQAIERRMHGHLALSRQMWQGPDRGRFDHDLGTVGLPAISSAISALQTAASELARNVVGQQQASAAGTGATTGPSSAHQVPRGGVGGAATMTSFPSGSAFHDQRLSAKGREVAIRAELADAVTGDKPLPDGYRRASTQELRDLGIDPKSLRKENGLDAAVFRGPDGKWFLAFEGTQNAEDWETNIRGAFHATPQHTEAIILARKLFQATDGNIEFVGHSLGGGLATAATVATGGRATTFNAAGLGPENYAIARLAGAGWSDRDLRALARWNATTTSIKPVLVAPWGPAVGLWDRASSNLFVQRLTIDQPVTNYKTTNDPLSNAQDFSGGLLAQRSVGEQVKLPPTDHSGHGMADVDEGIIAKFGGSARH